MLTKAAPIYKLKKVNVASSATEWQKIYAFRQKLALAKQEQPLFATSELFQQHYSAYLQQGFGIYLLWKNDKVYGFFIFSNREINGDIYTFLRRNFKEDRLEPRLLQLILQIYRAYSDSSNFLVFTSTCSDNDYLEARLSPEISEHRERFELSLQALDQDLLTTWNRPENDPDKYKLLFLEELPSALLEDYCTLVVRLNNDVTHRSRLFNEKLLSKKHILKREEAYRQRGIKHLTLLLFTRPEQCLIGYTDIIIDASSPTIATQSMTGLLPDYRGRGLSKVLKVRMIRHLLANYPKLKTMRTAIHPENHRSQALNRRLGYQQAGEYKEYIVSKRTIVNTLSISIENL